MNSIDVSDRLRRRQQVRDLGGRDPARDAAALACTELPLEAQAWILPTLVRAKNAKAATIRAAWNNRVTKSVDHRTFMAGCSAGEEVLLHASWRADALALESVTPAFAARVWLGERNAGEHTFAGRRDGLARDLRTQRRGPGDRRATNGGRATIRSWPRTPGSPLSRRGTFSVQFALLLITVMGFASLAVDRGVLQVYDQQIQNATDAIAHAAASSLDGTEAGIDRAPGTAALVASANRVGPSPLSIGVDTTLELGRWDGGEFVADTSDPVQVNAARVIAGRSDLRTIFAQIAFGRPHMAVHARAVGLSGGVGGSDCPLPIAVPSCSLPAGDAICHLDLSVSVDNNDNAGWAAAGSQRPSGSSVREAIEGGCYEPVLASDVVTLNNGSMTSAMKSLADAVSASPDRWDTGEWGTQPSRAARSGVSPYGRVLNRQVIVFEDPRSCVNTKFNGSSLEITGFLSVQVYDVVTSGSARDRQISMRSTCTTERGPPAGGGWYGTIVAPRLAL